MSTLMDRHHKAVMQAMRDEDAQRNQMSQTIERVQTPYRDFFTKAEEEYEELCHEDGLRKQEELRVEVSGLVRKILGNVGLPITSADFIGDRLILDGIRFYASYFDDLGPSLAVEFLCEGCGQRPSKVVTEAHEVLPSLRELEEKHVCKPGAVE